MEKAQVRAARALLGWSQEDLAARAGVSVATIRRQEPGHGQFSAGEEVLRKIAAALQDAGVELISSDLAKGHGVRLARASRRDLYDILLEEVDGAKKSLEKAQQAARDMPDAALVRAIAAALQSVAIVSQEAFAATDAWGDFITELDERDPTRKP
ncbi:helix-turn-helix domain-containing protein [Xanthobacter sp. 126]|uniref:helix-turn-helix domain-containing protein n=1 Tax=Xanthobacter sp. 126 TaxID=1131814 RepID=UPI0012DF0D43|nr:helix-turn-helix domain-containing protein [Xanthobacter sp. 126]